MPQTSLRKVMIPNTISNYGKCLSFLPNTLGNIKCNFPVLGGQVGEDYIYMNE